MGKGTLSRFVLDTDRFVIIIGGGNFDPSSFQVGLIAGVNPLMGLHLLVVFIFDFTFTVVD